MFWLRDHWNFCPLNCFSCIPNSQRSHAALLSAACLCSSLCFHQGWMGSRAQPSKLSIVTSITVVFYKVTPKLCGCLLQAKESWKWCQQRKKAMERRDCLLASWRALSPRLEGELSWAIQPVHRYSESSCKSVWTSISFLNVSYEVKQPKLCNNLK